MLDLDIRTAILTLRARGHGFSPIAHLLSVDKKTVKKVIASGQAEVPDLERTSQLDEYLTLIRTLHIECKGNGVRVHEELEKRAGVVV